MDYICKFISVDLFELLDWLFGGCCNESSGASRSLGPVKCLSFTIRHKYPDRLVTYDAEEAGEPRLIRYSGLSESLQKVMQPVCTKDDKKNMAKSKKERCEEVDKKDKANTKKERCKPLDLSKKFCKECLAELEQHSKELYQRSMERMCDQEDQKTPPNWEGLKPMQKLCSYWQALTGHELRSTPYENFKDIFSHKYRKQFPRAADMRTMLRRCWRCMSSKERVPFNLYSLLYHVSTGAVDPCDHCAVRVLLNRWR